MNRKALAFIGVIALAPAIAAGQTTTRTTIYRSTTTYSSSGGSIGNFGAAVGAAGALIGVMQNMGAFSGGAGGGGGTPPHGRPPASCARKFVGSWTVRVNATGQTYPGQLLSNGLTHATCPMCTPTGTWTCRGNTATMSVNGITISYSLSADGRTLSGSCCTFTRNGPAPATLASTEPVLPAHAPSHGPAQEPGSPRLASAPTGPAATPAPASSPSSASGARGSPLPTGAHGAGTNHPLPVPPTVPVPTASHPGVGGASESPQQVAMARRGEESAIFQRGSSGSSSGGGDCNLNLSPIQGKPLTFYHPCPSSGGGGSPSGGGGPRSGGGQDGVPAIDLTGLVAAPEAPGKPNRKRPRTKSMTPTDLLCARSPQEHGSDQPLPPLNLCDSGWDMSNMPREGVGYTHLCDDKLDDDDEYMKCAMKDENFGAAVLMVTDIGLYCYAGPDRSSGSELATCAARKFKNAWHDAIFHQPPIRCPTIQPPSPPTWTSAEIAYCKQAGPGLRKRIVCQINPARCDPPPAVPYIPPPPQTVQTNPPPQTTHDDPPPPRPSESTAFCNYMLDALARGILLTVSDLPEECRPVAQQPSDSSIPPFTLAGTGTDAAVQELVDAELAREDHNVPNNTDQNAATPTGQNPASSGDLGEIRRQ